VTNWLLEVLRFCWFALPLVVASLVHLIVLRLRMFEWLKIPLDGGATWRGHRIFGDNKTVRGAVVMIGVSVVTAVLQGVGRIPTLEYFDYGRMNLALLGFLQGLGFVLGELPNSFLKRRIGVAPGAPGGVLQAFGDHLDSVIGALLLVSIVWVPPLRVWAMGLVLGAGLHLAVNVVFVLLGVKRRAI
jgi:hypothetical protein